MHEDPWPLYEGTDQATASFHGQSMLSFFRRSSKLMIAILLMGLFAIVATGFGTDGMGGLGSVTGGPGGGRLVTVGGESVTTAELTDQVNRQLARARESQPELDMGSFLRGGAFEEVVRQLVSQASILAFASDQGLAASKRMVDAQIVNIPAFRNLAGQFDQNTFQQALAQEKTTEKELREDLAASLIQRQLLLPVAATPRVPQGLALQYASLLLEQRTGSVGLVPTATMGAGKEPTDAEVTAFFQQNQDRYTIPERRVLRYAVIGPEQVAAAAKPTEAEVAAAYQANAAKYAARETRTLSQVVLPDQAAARAFAAKLAGGASFAQAAQQAGFSAADTAVGEQTKDQFTGLTSAAVANAAFSAAEGATTAPLQSPLGWHVVRVDSIKRLPATPLAAVRGELEQQIAQRKQIEALGSLVTRIEEALEDQTFEEIARTEKLVVQETPPVTGTGLQIGVPGWRASPELGPLLKTGFEMSADDDPVVETITPDQRFAILAVARIDPAAPPPLPQIRDRVKADLIAKRASDRAKAVASSLVAKINAGVTPAQAFAEAGVRLPALQPISARRIDIAQPNQPVPPPLAMMFSLPRGKAKILAAPNGQGWFVVHHASSVAGDARSAPQLVAATQTQFQRILGEEYAAQFTRAVEQKMKVRRDENGLADVKRQLQGGTAR